MRRTFVRIILSLIIVAGLDLGSGLLLIPEDFNSFRASHYYYHHGLMPNQETLASWGALIYPMRTNSLGMIDSAVCRVDPVSENHRILILGDSHSEGVGVPYEKTFAGRLASSLKDHRMEVLNASAVSYSQKIEYLKARFLIEQEGLQVDEILVLVDISDIQNELVYENFQPAEKSGAGNWLYRLVNRLRNISLTTYLVDAVRTERQREDFFRSIETFYEDARQQGHTSMWELYSGFFSHFDNEVLLSNPQFHGMGSWMEDPDFRELAIKGITMGQEQISRLQEMCRERGIRLTLSVHPWHPQIRNAETSDAYVAEWETFARSEGIPFLNLYPLFINEEPPETVIRKYYIQNDNHWNEFGHARVADYLRGYFLGKKR